jgi:HlyD family secretion protein
LIAKDLSLLEIWASVNEADIGAIHPGQTARFSVASLPEKSFVGQVSQVRLNASMVHNVVTYTVVIDVDNSEGEILPYLTARVRFEVDERSDVLLVPNAALRFRPPRKSIAASSPRSGLGEREDRQAQGTLWVRSGERLRGLSVRLGATDGLFTEVEGEGIHEGLEVVVGQQTSQDAGSTSPFLPQFDEKKKKDEPKR